MFSFKMMEVMLNADGQSLLRRSRHDKLSVTVKINQNKVLMSLEKIKTDSKFVFLEDKFTNIQADLERVNLQFFVLNNKKTFANCCTSFIVKGHNRLDVMDLRVDQMVIGGFLYEAVWNNEQNDWNRNRFSEHKKPIKEESDEDEGGFFCCFSASKPKHPRKRNATFSLSLIPY